VSDGKIMTDQTHKPIIGLSGGIGSGKSTVAKFLAELGCVVADSDAIAREALRDPHIHATIVGWWGDSVLDPSGAINRKSIAQIIFEDPQQRQRLERLMHPWIEQRRVQLFEAAPADAPALVIDAPLLLESGLDRLCDAVIFVEAPQETRVRRVMETRGWTPAELHSREIAQMPLDRKRQSADYVLANQGELSDLRLRVEQLLRTILETCRALRS
jgi:dephospho-CoA kinase